MKLTKQINLTQGYVTSVDSVLYSWLSQCKWHVFKSSSGKMYAACSNQMFDGKKHKRLFMHRVINNTSDGMDTDHINGHSLDNRKSNLRDVTRSQNMWNRKPNSKGSSKYKGVYWHKQHKKWCASIQANKKRLHVGLFDCEIEASIEYNKKAKELFGKFNYGEKK